MSYGHYKGFKQQKHAKVTFKLTRGYWQSHHPIDNLRDFLLTPHASHGLLLTLSTSNTANHLALFPILTMTYTNTATHVWIVYWLLCVDIDCCIL